MKQKDLSWFLLKKKAFKPFKDLIASCFIPKAKQANYVFIMGHMRSRSTLLSHILCNHQQIIGIGETNRVYRQRLNFSKQVLACVYQERSLNGFNKWVLDQVNHNHKTPDIDLLKQYKLKIILLARNPKASIHSMLEAFGNNTQKTFTIDHASKYYQERLSFLIKIKEQWNPDDFICLDADRLVHDTEICLQEISAFLSLDQPLSSNYQVYNYTGKRGDTSENIFKGTILKSQNLKSPNIQKDLSEEYKLFDQLVS